MATTFTNQATLSYNGASIRSNVAVGVIEDVLSVAKNALTEEYSAGDTITYAVSIVNSGGSAIDGLSVTDDLGAYLFDTGSLQPLSYVDGTVQYYRDGVLQPDPAVSTADGLVISGISVPADGSVLILYSAAVNEFAPPGEGATVVNTVTVTGADICDISASETVTAAAGALLSVIKSVSPVPVSENGELTYTLRLENAGNTAVTAENGAVITDTFDPLLTNISVTLDGAALTPGTGYTYDETTGEFATLAGAIAIPAATFTQDAATGEWTVTPGSATLVVSGTVGAVCDGTAP